MKSIVALVGCPNVGKSTIFNRLTRSRDALVANEPGVTRDRIYGIVNHDEHDFVLVDTGGLSGEEQGLSGMAAEQARKAIAEADLVLFVVDARAGRTVGDEAISAYLRAQDKSVIIIANKAEGIEPAIAAAEFQQLGMGQPLSISASHGEGITSLLGHLSEMLPVEPDEEASDEDSIRVAVIGRPNVGKSTLINRMLGEERLLAFDQPGTTRDSIAIPLEREGKHYTLIDTAGVRRRARVSEMIEKFSVIKALKAIEACHVVLLMLDAREGVTDQDATLAGLVVDSGRALIVALNKWDGLDADQRQNAQRQYELKLPFIDYASVHNISALHGTGVGKLFGYIDRCYRSLNKKVSTAQMTRMLEEIVRRHPPPLIKGRRIKLRYAHQGGHNPLQIIIHGNQVKAVPDSYRRYLINAFRKMLQLEGTPVRIAMKSGDNPYDDKKSRGKTRVLSKPRNKSNKPDLYKSSGKSSDKSGAKPGKKKTRQGNFLRRK